MDSLQTTLINSVSKNNNTKKKHIVFSWLWFPNISFMRLPTNISFIPSFVSPSHSLFVSREDFQQSFKTEMSVAGKEADDYCSWGLLEWLNEVID